MFFNFFLDQSTILPFHWLSLLSSFPQVAELKLDNLQPQVTLLLKEGKAMADREGKQGDSIREALLDLSRRWLKNCDDVEKKKKAIEVVPHWYQFKSNLNDINGWILKIDEHKDVEVGCRYCLSKLKLIILEPFFVSRNFIASTILTEL